MNENDKVKNTNLPVNSITQKDAPRLVEMMQSRNFSVNYEYVNEFMGIWEDGETDIDPFAVEFYIPCGESGLRAFADCLKELGITLDWDSLYDLTIEDERIQAIENGISCSYGWKCITHDTIVGLRLEGPFDLETAV